MEGVLSIPPSTSWQVYSSNSHLFMLTRQHRDGNDGPWSSITLQIGHPPQEVRVFPSSSGSSVWAVVPQGCSTTTDPANCPQLRGGVFDSTSTTSWVEKGIYNLPLSTESLWGYSGNGDFGFDTVTLGYPGGGGPTLNDTLVAGIATKDFLLGSLGLTLNGVNFTNLNDPAPALLATMFDQGLVGSHSWGYTAGSFNSPKQTFSSLTFGGFDQSRFLPNNLTITRGQDISRDLLVGIQTITSGTQSLLPTGVIALIDSTVAEIWLPVEACQRFEEVFGIVWDADLELYVINSTIHDNLRSENPSMTFTIGSSTTGNDIVDITLDYASFDLTASWPLAGNETVPYFPLRQAHNETQYVLGRTFLQQSYLTVDYDRNNFSISQAIFPDTNEPQKLTAIAAPAATTSTSRHLGVGAYVGIAIGAVAVLAFMLLMLRIVKRRHAATKGQQANSPGSQNDASAGLGGKAELHGRDLVPGYPQTEEKSSLLAASTKFQHQELDANRALQAEVQGRQILELPGAKPEFSGPRELPGRSPSEIRTSSQRSNRWGPWELP